MENNTTGQEINKVEEGQKERMPSKAQAIQALKRNISNLKKSGLINDKDEKLLAEVYTKIVKQYMGFELAL